MFTVETSYQIKIVLSMPNDYHLLGKCAAYMLMRQSILGAYLMEPEELGKVSLTTLFRFVRAIKRIP